MIVNTIGLDTIELELGLMTAMATIQCVVEIITGILQVMKLERR